MTECIGHCPSHDSSLPTRPAAPRLMIVPIILIIITIIAHRPPQHLTHRAGEELRSGAALVGLPRNARMLCNRSSYLGEDGSRRIYL